MRTASVFLFALVPLTQCVTQNPVRQHLGRRAGSGTVLFVRVFVCVPFPRRRCSGTFGGGFLVPFFRDSRAARGRGSRTPGQDSGPELRAPRSGPRAVCEGGGLAPAAPAPAPLQRLEPSVGGGLAFKQWQKRGIMCQL